MAPGKAPDLKESKEAPKKAPKVIAKTKNDPDGVKSKKKSELVSQS